MRSNPEMRARFPEERGKDYNHFTFCDLVITGLCGFVPDGAGGFRVDPLADPAWDWFVLDNLRWRGHDISVRFLRGEGLSVSVDGRTSRSRDGMFRLSESSGMEPNGDRPPSGT